MERRRRSNYLYLASHLPNTTFTHSLSFSLMAKQKLEEEKQQLQLQNQANIKILKLWICLLLNPKGDIYRHQGKGGQGDNLWPKARAWLRPYGHVSAALPGRCAPGRLLHCVASVPCWMDLLDF